MRCHGLVFASRRSNIPPCGVPTVDVDDILRRDGYAPVQGSPKIGDVAVYRTGPRQVEHTGLVSSVSSRDSNLIPTVFVWSKWGMLGEYEHPANNVPEHFGVVEYWRLDPNA